MSAFVCVIAKWPHSGRSKTRLAAHTGLDQAQVGFFCESALLDLLEAIATSGDAEILLHVCNE